MFIRKIFLFATLVMSSRGRYLLHYNKKSKAGIAILNANSCHPKPVSKAVPLGEYVKAKMNIYQQ